MNGGSPTPHPPLAARRRRLDASLDREGLEAVWFARPNSFAWLTGASNVVDRDAPVGVAAAGYDRTDGFRVVSDNIEANRLREESLPAAFAVESVPWYERSLAEAVADRSPTPAAADFEVAGLRQVDPTALRQPLTDADVDAYRVLGSEVATAVESVCLACGPRDTDLAVAADVRRALESRGIAAPVVLVGGGERAGRYRHYTPTTATLGGYALVSVTAQRGGLYASATRTVAFEAPEWLPERHRAAATVEASALAATQRVGSEAETQRVGSEGGTAGDVFEAIQSAYAAVGWPEEWTNHHQGGAAGFAGREWIARPTSEAPVSLPMAYAWNPTVAGAKSEGTVLVDSETIEPLTTTGEWPTIAVDAVGDAANRTLRRPAVLTR